MVSVLNKKRRESVVDVKIKRRQCSWFAHASSPRWRKSARYVVKEHVMSLIRSSRDLAFFQTNVKEIICFYTRLRMALFITHTAAEIPDLVPTFAPKSNIFAVTSNTQVLCIQKQANCSLTGQAACKRTLQTSLHVRKN